MPTTTITLHLYDTGLLDCWVQEEGGATISFDPLQLPSAMKDAMGKALANALGAKTAAEWRATIAEAKEAEAVAKVEEVAGLLAIKEQLDAKDAIIQQLLSQNADLQAAAAS